MPAVNTRADSLRLFITGATSHKGTQANPLASFGNYQSSTECISRVAAIANAISNVTIDFIFGANNTGNGTLTALDANNLQWTSPGGSAGNAQTISNGQQIILEDGGDPSKYIRVSRTSAVALSGTATVTLAVASNNAIAGADTTVAEQNTGKVTYSAVMFENTGAATINNLYLYLKTYGTNRVSAAGQLPASGAGTLSISSGTFDDWPQSGYCRIEQSNNTLREIVYYSARTSTSLTIPTTGRGLLGTSANFGVNTDNLYCVSPLRIASETPVANQIQTIANATTAPTGRTWKTGIRTTDGINVASLAAGGQVGLWIENTVIAGAAASSNIIDGIAWSFEAS